MEFSITRPRAVTLLHTEEKGGYPSVRASSLHRNVARSKVTMSHTALTHAPDHNWLYDSQAFAFNRLSARSTHRSTAPSQSLDGTWEVALTSGTAISLDSPTDAFNQGDIHSILVPSTLETQGLWPPAYVNIHMPGPSGPGRTPRLPRRRLPPFLRP